MEDQIIETLTLFFQAVDRRNWPLIRRMMAENVLSDHSSVNLIHLARESVEEITDAWTATLPGYDKTSHQLSDFQIRRSGNKALATCKGRADHFLGDELYTIEGLYEAEMQVAGGNWLVTGLKFSADRISGNLELPALAAEKVRTRSLLKVEFHSEGLTLKGLLHVPAGFNEYNLYQGILVTGSQAAVGEQLPQLYAAKLANQGFIALTFDFSGFGESEGEPRNVEDLQRKALEIRNAVSFLALMPFVATNSIGGITVGADPGPMALAITQGAKIKVVNFIAPRLDREEPLQQVYAGDGLTGNLNALMLAPQLKIPVQIIHSEVDGVAAGTKEFHELLPGKKNIVWLDEAGSVNHPEQYTSTATRLVVKWFNRELKNY